MNKVEALIAAKELIADPKNWIKGNASVDSNGVSVNTLDPSACAFCMLGAVYKVVPDKGFFGIRQEVRNSLRESVKRKKKQTTLESIADFNDSCNTTHKDVMDVFDDAIMQSLNTKVTT